MGGHNKAIEVAQTVLDVAEVAWKAVEVAHHHKDHHNDETLQNQTKKIDEELDALRIENARLRELLEQNIKLLHEISESPILTHDCPCPKNINSKLVSVIESEDFLNQLKPLESEVKTNVKFPSKEPTDNDVQLAEVLVNVEGEKNPSKWVWVNSETAEERSEIDGENYVIITEENVVDAVANFMAKCITSNSKARNLPPKELQKALARSLSGVNKLEKMMSIWHAGKLFYAFATWGLALAGIYRTRAVIKVAALGVHSTSKLALKLL